MIVKLDKARKIALLEALQSGEIETAIVESWRSDSQALTDDELENEIVKIELSTNANLRLCEKRIKHGVCPYAETIGKR